MPCAAISVSPINRVKGIKGSLVREAATIAWFDERQSLYWQTFIFLTSA